MFIVHRYCHCSFQIIIPIELRGKKFQKKKKPLKISKKILRCFLKLTFVRYNFSHSAFCCVTFLKISLLEKGKVPYCVTIF